MSSLPLSWIETLFARFSAAWGAQKIGAMFPADSHDDVKSLWADQLGRFEPETLRHALQAAIDTGKEWPPSLPEFVAVCQRSAVERKAHAPAVALPMPKASPDVVAKALDGIGAVDKSRDMLRWARHPKSRKAVEFLLSGATRDHRLLAIAREHVREGGTRIQCDDGRRFLFAAAESNPALRDAA